MTANVGARHCEKSITGRGGIESIESRSRLRRRRARRERNEAGESE
jgi:hypothetical protein